MSEHRDPLDLLDDFDAGAPMPATPAEIRRRGDRRRRRTTALVAAGAAAAVAAVVVPLSVLGNGDERSIEPALPTISAEVDLLDAAEVPTREGFEPWTVDTDRRADDTGTLACSPAPVDELGARAVLTRDFVAERTLPPGTTADPNAPDIPSGQAREAVLQFADLDAAAAAYDEALGWIADCPGVDDARPVGGGLQQTTLDGGRSQYAAWRLPNADYCPDGCDIFRFVDMGVAQLGDRLVLTSYQVLQGPNPPQGLDRSMRAFVRNATTKARPDVDTLEPDDPSTTAEPTETSPPPLPDAVADFPLDASITFGDQANFTFEGSDFTRRGPSATAPGVELPEDFCGRDVWPVDDVQARLGFLASGPEYGLRRELAVFDDADRAVAVLAALRDELAACPRVPTGDGDGALSLFDEVDLDSGYDDVSFTHAFSAAAQNIGGYAYQFVRVGRAVLATVVSGEFGNAAGSADALERLDADNRGLTPQMCAFTEAGC